MLWWDKKLEDDFVLNGIKLGNRYDDIKKHLGNPIKSTAQNNGVLYEYGNIQIFVLQDGSVGIVKVEGDEIKTARGLIQGSKETELFEKYGENYEKTEKDGAVFYLYTVNSQDRGLMFVFNLATGGLEKVASFSDKISRSR